MLKSFNRIAIGLQLVVVIIFGFHEGANQLRANAPEQNNDFAERSRELLAMSEAALSREDLKNVSFRAIKTGEAAISAGDYSAALKIAVLAVKTGELSNNNHVQVLASKFKKRSFDLTREYRKVKIHHKNIQENPDNPESAFLYGKFLALKRNDWESGLPLLAKGDNAAYRFIAEKELAQPKSISKYLEIADGWLIRSLTEKDQTKRDLEMHAYDWFTQAWSQASGAERIQISTKMDDLPIRYLNHMDEKFVVKGAWPLGKNGDCGNQRGNFKVNNLEFPNGLGLHPPNNGLARVTYQLKGQYTSFATGVALIDDEYAFKGTVYFSVVGDGKLLWKSEPVRKRGEVQFCSVTIRNVKNLEIWTESPGRAVGGHAVWLDPRVLK
jgi:hypothetical protein